MDAATNPGATATGSEKPVTDAPTKTPSGTGDVKTGDVESDQGRELAPEATNQTDSANAPVINYKTLSWWAGGLVLIAETVSLGILALPSVLAQVGLVPGVILILIMSGLSTYSCVLLGEFRKAYPHVQNFGDAVEVLGRSIGMGRVFQEVFGWGQVIFQVLVAGSHVLTFTILANTLSDSATCTIVWAVVGMVVFWILNLPRTLKYTSLMSLVSCLSIVVATLMTVGDVAQNRPIGSNSIDIARQVPFTSAFLAVTNIAVAFSSHSCFFSVIGEFKDERDWPKALAMLQIVDTVLYLIAAIVIYESVGPDVPSPALSASNSVIMRKAIWGVAIPTIIIAGVIYNHVAARYVFVRIFRNTKHEVRRTKLSTFAWIGITFTAWLVAMVVAESVPVFNSLLGLVSALFVSWFSYGLPGIFWLWMNWGKWFNRGWKSALHAIFSMILLLTGTLLCVLGLWSAGVAIAEEEKTLPWTCKSNAAA